jgi:phosphate transport system permease protein
MAVSSTSTAVGPAGFRWSPQAVLRRLRGGDAIAHIVTLVFAAIVLLITVLLVEQLWVHSAASRAQYGWHFLWTSVWDPVFDNYGALTFLYGTIVTTVLALVIAVPLGLGAAIFLSELAPPKISAGLSFVVDLLAAVPSVIYGLLAIFTLLPLLATTVEPFLKRTLGFLPLFQGPAYGVGFLAAGLVLAIMIVPYIVSVSREVLMSVPNDQREAALGLGATRWETTWKVVVPFARTGIMGSVFLSMARALGETMAVTMVIGNTPKISASLFAPGYTIAAVIANEFTEATGALYQSSLIELALVLFLLTFILNGLARLMMAATAGRGSGGGRT